MSLGAIMPEFRTSSELDLPAGFMFDAISKNKVFTVDELVKFTTGYFTAMLRANVSWNTYSGDAPEYWGNGDIELTEEHRMKLSEECIDFLASNIDDVRRYAIESDIAKKGYDGIECAGHDFALSRNGHGCGFWDRGLGTLGDRLHKAAKVYGEANISAEIVNDEIVVYVD